MILYDPRCHELAEHFLSDDDVPATENELRIQSLAGAIQQAVEDWCESEPAAMKQTRCEFQAPNTLTTAPKEPA